MAQQIRFQVLKTLSGQEYQFAINGILLDGKRSEGSSLLVSTDRLASIFSMTELVEMLESKKRCEEYRKKTFVSNRELADWLRAREGRSCHVVLPGQMIVDGKSYTEWNYAGGTGDCNASDGAQIYVVEAGSCSLEFLTRKAVGLE